MTEKDVENLIYIFAKLNPVTGNWMILNWLQRFSLEEFETFDSINWKEHGL